MAKILFLCSRFPLPADKGDKLRVYYQLKELAVRHEVHLFALSEQVINSLDYAAISTLCKSVHVHDLPLLNRYLQLAKSLYSGIPFQVAYFYHPFARKSFLKLVNDLQPDFIHCHLIRTTEYVRSPMGIPLSLDFMDAFGEGMAMRASTERNPLKRFIFKWESKKLFRYEKEVFSFIHRFCIISDQDKKRIHSPENYRICIVANGVDFEIFKPRDEIKRYDLVFMGNLDYPPNLAAIQYLMVEIMPLLTKQRPDIRLLIAGAGATEKILKYRSANTEIITDLKDISDSIAWSKIMIAPMITSIGLQNKIIQAMAMKVPCVVSMMANRAIGAPSPEAIRVAANAGEYVTAILDLMDNETLMTETGQRGFEFVRKHFRWSSCSEALEKTIFGDDSGMQEKPLIVNTKSNI